MVVAADTAISSSAAPAGDLTTMHREAGWQRCLGMYVSDAHRPAQALQQEAAGEDPVDRAGRRHAEGQTHGVGVGAVVAQLRRQRYRSFVRHAGMHHRLVGDREPGCCTGRRLTHDVP